MTVGGRLIFDAEAFTASKDLQTLTPGAFVDRLTFAWKVEATAASAVSVETALDLLQDLEVRLKGSVVNKIRGSDLYALNDLYLGKRPIAVESGATTDSQTKILGLEAPLHQPARAGGDLTMVCNRTAVAGADTETLTVHEAYSDKALEDAWLHYSVMPGTTSATTGYGNFVDLPQPGDLDAILFWSTTIPTNAATTATVQKINLQLDKRIVDARSWVELRADSFRGSTAGLLAQPTDVTHLDNYAIWDLSKDPVSPDREVRLDIYGGVASEAFRVIPIYKCKG